MYNHEPIDYKCPFCEIAAGKDTSDLLTKQSNVFYRNDSVIGFINAFQWPNNPGNVLIIPTQHIENIYDMPDSVLQKVFRVVKQVSIAIKQEYGCDGISIRQHNEPIGEQQVWHFHVHIFPRYPNDNLYLLNNKAYKTREEDRNEYVQLLKKYFISLKGD